MKFTWTKIEAVKEDLSPLNENEFELYYMPETYTIDTEDNKIYKNIHLSHINSDTYNSYYKDKLLCIYGNCKAKIKFTQRKDGTKFFSTWNKQGLMYSEDCPYLLKYVGSVRRKEILEKIVNETVDDDYIERSLLSKSKRLKRRNELNLPKTPISTRDIIESGTIEVENGTENVDMENGSVNSRIMSINSQIVDYSYVGTRKCIYGVINTVYFDPIEKYAYINLKNDKCEISAYFPEAFYSNETNTVVDDLRDFIEIIKENKVNSTKEIVLICYGFINKKKKGPGLNIHLLSKKHLLINEMKFDDVLNGKKITECKYYL